MYARRLVCAQVAPASWALRLLCAPSVGSRALSSEASTAVALADPSGKPPSKEPRKVYNPLVPLNVSSDPLAAVGEEVAMPNYYVRRSKDRFARSSRKLDLPIVLKTDYEGLGKKGDIVYVKHPFMRLFYYPLRVADYLNNETLEFARKVQRERLANNSEEKIPVNTLVPEESDLDFLKRAHSPLGEIRLRREILNPVTKKVRKLSATRQTKLNEEDF